LTAAGQTFRMAMYHENHPDGAYQTINQVLAFDPPSAISWKPGHDAGDGRLEFGGWTWRYSSYIGTYERTVFLSATGCAQGPIGALSATGCGWAQRKQR
jgi:hypothetical protein